MTVTTNFDTEAVKRLVDAAKKAALKDVITDITQESKENTPKRTGNNMRSIAFDVGPGGDLNLTEDQGAVYSTSGYGGYLETGTSRMAARPYMKPAADRNFTEENVGNLVRKHLGET